MENDKYMKNYDVDVNIMFFHVFHVFRGARSTKTILSGYSLDAELNYPSNDCAHSKFE